MGKENYTPSAKSEELTLETPEQAEARIRAEVDVPNVEVQATAEVQDKGNVSETGTKPLTASEELMQIRREKLLNYRGGSLENMQSAAEQTNIAFDLAKARGIDIDFSQLDDMILIPESKFIIVPKLDGTALFFSRSDKEVIFVVPIVDNSDGSFGFDTEGEPISVSSKDNQRLREKYKPEQLEQLFADAEDIYEKRMSLKKYSNPSPEVSAAILDGQNEGNTEVQTSADELLSRAEAMRVKERTEQVERVTDIDELIDVLQP